MIAFAAKGVKKYYVRAFVTAIIAVLLNSVCIAMDYNTMLGRVVLILTLAIAVVCMLFTTCMLALLLQVLLTLGTGYGWREKIVTPEELQRYHLMDGLEVPEGEQFCVRVWHGIGMPVFVGRIEVN